MAQPYKEFKLGNEIDRNMMERVMLESANTTKIGL
jgi:hypothetical protein